jgi:hypothetical protein
MATEHDVGQFGSGLGVSQVDHCHYQSGIAPMTPPYLSAGVDIHGSGGDQFSSATQTGTGLFKNAFADQWTAEDDPLPEETPSCTDTPTTRVASKAAFTHITDVILDNPNATKALKCMVLKISMVSSC